MPVALKEMNDQDLLVYYQNVGDKLAVGELFKRHSLLCFAVCNKYLKNEEASNDAVMQIFENLFQDLLKHQILNFKSWLHSVARNHCLMILRKQDILLQFTESEDENEFMENRLLLHQEDNKQELELKLVALESAISGLNQKQQDCIRLFYLNQLTYEQVSAQTGYDLNEVKSAIQNGKRNIKLNLTEKGITYLLVCLSWIQQSA